jgi:hypothetical protein
MLPFFFILIEPSTRQDVSASSFKQFVSSSLQNKTKRNRFFFCRFVIVQTESAVYRSGYHEKTRSNHCPVM